MTEHLFFYFLARCSGVYGPSVPHIFTNQISRKEHIPIRYIPQIFGCFHCKCASLLPACYAELKSSSCEDHHRCQTYARHGTVVFGSFGLVYLASTLLLDSIGSLLYLLYILFLAGKFLPCQLLMLWNWLYQIVLGRVPVMLLSRLIIVHAFSHSRGNNLRRNILSV
ncbi:hypothetical protein ACSBR1_027346 [Camellia fascicularis]